MTYRREEHNTVLTMQAVQHGGQCREGDLIRFHICDAGDGTEGLAINVGNRLRGSKLGRLKILIGIKRSEAMSIFYEDDTAWRDGVNEAEETRIVGNARKRVSLALVTDTEGLNPSHVRSVRQTDSVDTNPQLRSQRQNRAPFARTLRSVQKVSSSQRDARLHAPSRLRDAEFLDIVHERLFNARRKDKRIESSPDCGFRGAPPAVRVGGESCDLRL